MKIPCYRKAVWCLLAGVLFGVLAQGPALAAEVHTIDGRVFEGKILEEEEDHLLVRMEGGVEVRIERPQVLYVQKEEDPDRSRSDYPVLGATYGMPGLFNLVAGYYSGDWGAKVSGGGLGDLAGVQLDLSRKWMDHKPFLGNLSLVGGYVGLNKVPANASLWGPAYGVTKAFFYGGLGLDVNWGGFAFELGLVGGDFPSQVAFPFQVGYVHRFN